MGKRYLVLWGQTNPKILIGLFALLAVFALSTESTMHGVVPLAIMVGGVLGYDVVMDLAEFPNGSKQLVYGTAVLITGGSIALFGSPWFGGLFALVGCWIALDGMSILRYEQRTVPPECFGKIDTKTVKIRLRMETVNRVLHHLRNTTEPQSPAEISAALDLTESHTKAALDCLLSNGGIEHVESRVLAEPPRWERLDAAVRSIRWLPRRLFQPFYLMYRGI